jgi:hypothetical protein
MTVTVGQPGGTSTFTNSSQFMRGTHSGKNTNSLWCFVTKIPRLLKRSVASEVPAEL